MELSLLYPDTEKYRKSFSGEGKPEITKETASELGFSNMIELKSCDAGDYLTCDPQVISYRLEAFSDMLENSALGEVLLSVFPILHDIIELRRLDADSASTTEEYLYSISEIELYISCVDKLWTGLAPMEGSLKSRAFKALTERIKELRTSDYYTQLNKKLEELTARVRDIKSVTIGVNLDAQLRPSDAGVLSINPEKFRSGDVLEKILRLNFKEDEYTCIASLVPFTKGQTENTKIALSYAFNSAINEVFKTSIRSWKKIVQLYVLDNTDFLLGIMPEIEFLTRAAEMLTKLRNKGCPLTSPVLCPQSEKAFDAKGLYNPDVALRIDEPIVKNDITFDDRARIYILTGPNRGGKSVITCAVGLCQMMAQLGMPVPADSVRISPVDGIFVHFPTGSEDTIEKGRLGEECARLRSIFDKITENSLVLLDESLSSTGAYEASYIASELIRGFSKVGCRTVFSTHLHELAARLDEINQMCAEDGGSPVDSLVARISEGKRSFRIERVRPDGKSYASDIADKYGLSYQKITENISQRKGK